MNFKIKSQLLVICLAFVVLNACTTKNDLIYFGLNGNVKSFKEKAFHAEKKEGNWQQGDAIGNVFDYEVFFDENGFYTRINNYDNFQLSQKTLPKRKNGDVYEVYYYDSDDKLLVTTKVTFSSSEEVKFENISAEGKRLSKGIIYLENGRNKRQEMVLYEGRFDGDDVEKVMTDFIYDKDGNLIRQKNTNDKNEIESDIKYEYLEFDEYNNWTKRLEYSMQNDSSTPDKITIRTYEYY
ncbi:hypothetical protein EZY14_006305 [Kordia sp. TARA_039_SRF]|nr:hypothetical protein EZY14_006305 [Kordia sp. TARA_039_SRF]